jgi:snurportin-1
MWQLFTDQPRRGARRVASRTFFPCFPCHMEEEDTRRQSVKHSARNGREQQRRRREEVLAQQKARRAALLLRSRSQATPLETAVANLEDPVSADGASASAMDAAATIAAPDAPAAVFTAMDTSSSGGKPADGSSRNGKSAHPLPTDALMTAEWLVDVPLDLASHWYITPRPAGRRCLLVASGGLTRAYSRSGKPRSFPSALPNGSRATRGGMSTCELDCIWSEQEQTYYVVDLLSWKGHGLTDCSAEFRVYWLGTKLAEARTAISSSRNPCAIVPLPYAPCTPAQLQQVYAGETPFKGAAKDGMLFLHRESLYEPGPSPLLLSWADGSCSQRFYDYGSAQMASAIGQDPSKAGRWRVDEVDAACCFADILQGVEQPPMATDDAPELATAVSPSSEAQAGGTIGAGAGAGAGATAMGISWGITAAADSETSRADGMMLSCGALGGAGGGAFLQRCAPGQGHGAAQADDTMGD